ncbi:sensor histidine kinase [Isoptericola cucumis]|uniref:sensor histidine kinase n=1 Tax=Isoptericola cucumis TaxID=1776856 RepID=UPI00320A4BF8
MPVSLTRGVHVAFAALVVTSALRYLTNHGPGGRWWLVVLLTLGVGAAYAVLVVLARRPATAAAHVVLGLLLAGWLVLVLVAPSFAWSAIPLFFVCRSLVPAPGAHVLVGAVAVVTGAALWQLSGGTDWAAAVAPLVVAVLLSLAYDAIARQATERVRLQREVAVLAERERVAREIHDTLAQSLSSAVLHLEAADQRWDDPSGDTRDTARDDVRQAAVVVRGALGQTRELVHDLVEPAAARDGVAPAELEAAVLSAARRHVPDAELTVVGEPTGVGPDVAHALARIAQSAVANTRRHAGPARLGLTITYLPDAVALDVFDDGRGFDVGAVASRTVGATGGFGLRAMRQRVEQLGGTITVESTPGEGTVVGVQLPAGAGREEGAR